jgi:hypothetical protein
MMLFQIAGITPEASVTSRQLASVHVLVSKLPVQNRESETIPSAMSGRTVATTPYRDQHRSEPRAARNRPEAALAAVRDEARVVSEEHPVHEQHEHPEDEQRRADRRGHAVLSRYLLRL